MPHSSTSARLFGGLVFALPLILSGCANKPNATGGGGTASNAIIIGEYGSMTGAQATFGSATDNGIQLAVSQINSSGGIDGHKVQIGSTGKPEDDQGQPDGALTAVKKMITQDKAVAVLGEVASKNSIAAAPFCNSNKVPMISPSSTNPKVTQTGPYIFRVCFTDKWQGLVAARFAREVLKAKTVAVLYDTTSDYSKGLQGFFQEDFKKLGGTVVNVSTYTSGDPDFRSALTTIKSTNPDLLFVPGYYTDIGPIARQAREVGIQVPLLGGDGWESPDLLKGAGGALEGCYFVDHSALNEKDPVVKKFVEAFKTAYHVQDVDALSAQGYDAANVLFAAFKAAGKPADGDYNSDAYRAKLRDAIAATKDFQGATGNITLDANRDAKKAAVVLQIKGSSYKNVVATYQP
ncbi:MAG: ABC transporter substrate-binding protein [Armatimonadota bacterium]|nr:ABC transporter substrate-binding protein [Armatimonadota bacterium]